MASHNDFGNKGEQLAKQFLENSGYEILDENWIFKKQKYSKILSDYQNYEKINVYIGFITF
jgi:putative endonuclease